MDNRFNHSQSLFVNSQQIFKDLDPLSTQGYSQNTIQQNLKRPDEIFSEQYTRKVMKNGVHSDPRVSKFAAPLAKPQSSTFDVFDPVQTQSPFCFGSSLKSSSPVSRTKKVRCFQIPFSQKTQSQSLPQVISKKDERDLLSENVSKVEDFINKYNGTSGQKIKVAKDSVVSGRFNYDSPTRSSEQQTPQPRIVPETPCLDKFSAQSYNGDEFNGNSTEDNLIFGSDDEAKGTIYGPTLQTPGRVSLPPVKTPGGTTRDGIQLRSVEEIHPAYRYRSIFDGIPYFNIVQSKVFDDALYTDNPMVVCAPTGSGKTLIFELAITRLLIKNEELTSTGKHVKKGKPKIVYMAPIKALCSERHEEWSRKFHSVGLECQELTGDSEVDEYWQLQKVDVILTTPEKWDSMTRRWRDNTSLVRQVNLFLIDEVHLLNDEERGATMEAVVSRMKTIQTSSGGFAASDKSAGLRFVAVSATIPNTKDIAEWLGSSKQPAVSFDMDDSYRPVKLRKVVLGYPWSSNSSQFKFDIGLNYKLGNVIQTYSDSKPTLVFCSTRKGTEQAATTLAKDLSFVNGSAHKQTLVSTANLIRNNRLREMLQRGIGYHHAGLDAHDRHLVEELFTQGDLLVLVSTSTLAMGVNLPAHLVVIKATCHYVRGMFQEYSQSEILQMIGRAGRPQFDTTATAVIMTKNHTRDLYHNVVNGSQKIESSLHRHLIEHLNAEIVLTTVHDVTNALEWIRSTFLYIRLLKNPTYYGYAKGTTHEEAENRLHELCMRNLDSLTAVRLVSIDDKLRLMSSEGGKLMARYFIAFETIKKFEALTGQENLGEMVEIISSCREFQEVTLRMNERSTLNKMNKDKNRVTIRFSMAGRIKTTQMKVSCLIQATLGCISVQDFALSQDVNRIFRNAMRVSRCLVELLFLKDNFKSLYSAVVLSKCIKAKLWENSRYITKQLPSIGLTLSTALANAGVCSFAKLEATDPRELELIVNRHPPFGNHLRDAVKYLPKYAVHVEQGKRYAIDTCDITVQVFLNNTSDLKEKKTAEKRHGWFLLIGDADNKAVLKQRLSDTQLLTTDNHAWTRTLTIHRATKGDELSVNLISQEWVGLDVESTYSPYYLGPRRMTATTTGVKSDIAKESKYFDKKKKPCRHTCSNKRTCGHECCKIPGEYGNGVVERHANVVKDRILGKENIPKGDGNGSSVEYLQKYQYNRKAKYSDIPCNNQVVPSTPSLQRNKGWERLDSFCDFQQTQDDKEMLENLSAFEREQRYYDDQIDLGSRISYDNDVNEIQESAKKIPASQRLWSEKGDTQDPSVIDLTEPELVDIRPRQGKHGFKNVSKTDSNETFGQSIMVNTESMTPNTRNKMGKVFAWKSSACPRSDLFHRSSLADQTGDDTLWSTNHCTESSQMDHVSETFNTTPTTTHGNSTNSFPAFVKLNYVPSCHTSSNFTQGTNNSKPVLSVRGPVGYENSYHSKQDAQRNSQVRAKDVLPSYPAFNNTPSHKDFDNQLWEQAPSADYPSFNVNSKKRVTFQDQTRSCFKNAQSTVEEEEVSFNCDFTLEDEDDLLMMEACLQAEGQPQSGEQAIDKQTSSEEIPLLSREESFAAARFKRPYGKEERDQSHVLPMKKQFTGFFNNSCQQPLATVKKTQDVADAKKMFDSIFDGIF